MPRNATVTTTAARASRRANGGPSLPPARHLSRKRGHVVPDTPDAHTVGELESLLAETPHTGREAEYEAVVAFVSRRLSHGSNTSLFVCGGCGCGKTSTVKRALRAMSARVLPCDATTRTLVKRSSAEDRGWRCGAADSASAGWPAATLSTPRSSYQPATAEKDTPPCSTDRRTPSSTAVTLSHTPSPDTAHPSTPPSAAATASRLAPSSPPSGRPSVSSDDSTATALAAAGPVRGTKRGRDTDGWESEHDGPRRDMAGLATVLFASDADARHSSHEPQPFGLPYFSQRYPELFSGSHAAAPPSSSLSSSRLPCVLGHYVNCADISGVVLVEAVCSSIRAACTRGDAATQLLLQRLASVGKGVASHEWGVRDAAAAAAATTAGKHPRRPPLHVVALDEVEYLRGGGAAMLSRLAELAFQHPAQLAFIFISNQRAFVHVPQMMLEALLFEPYSEAQLRCIGAASTAAELQRCEQLACAGDGPATARRVKRSKVSARVSASAGDAPLRAADVDIKPRLFDYIARKALLEYAGDVRQVTAMCHRVVSVAWQEVTEARRGAAAAAAATPTVAPTRGGRKRSGVAVAEAREVDLPAKLEAAVEAYTARTSAATSGVRSSTEAAAAAAAAAAADAVGAGESSSGASSTRSSGAGGATAAAAHAAAARAVPSCPSALSGVMTLAKTVRVLTSNQVESDIDKHVGTLPEQTLYVLSCIVVLTLRRQEERSYAATSVGGRMGTTRTPGAGLTAAQRAARTLSLKMHEVHQLYTRLMAALHFPAMRADGFPLQVECLADFGVLTRPQPRGTDCVFSLNGVWTLPAMQAALVKRGEAIKQDRAAAGAGAMATTVMENRFEVVLRELATLVK
ncbi:hypothetical protein NESM_000348200 [Novymonas esmeraldas]|uniref:AAA+ ATPase domain-containing protein n=1 Tax=Novymonas esmeraldas TaxID=1808958 RepID=A0AAW0EN46_9TRYP